MHPHNLERKLAAMEASGAALVFGPAHTIDEAGATRGMLGWALEERVFRACSTTRPTRFQPWLGPRSGDAQVPPNACRYRGTMTPNASVDQILALVSEYAGAAHAPRAFDPENPRVPASGRVFGPEEVVELVRTSLDFWLTAGPEARVFERDLARRTGQRHALLVNSGSSANLLALTALTSPKLGDRRLRPGDEVITVAAGFPTTVNPIIQNGLVPVFVDVTLPSYNIDVSQLEGALSERTRALMVAHTLGNPFDLDAVSAFCERHQLFLIEDCCDALGSTWRGEPVGTFGELATLSFYPAHQITLGEGGAVLTRRPKLKKIVESYRDWGRDCWCEPGCADTCGKRFTQQFGDLPYGYDHKFVYSHLGYNLKATDMQAAIGTVQLSRLDDFVARRRENHSYLREALAPWSEYLILPEQDQRAETSWFGFAVTVRPEAPYTKHDLVTHLHGRGIDSRQLMAGNLLRQPAYSEIEHRVAAPLSVTDLIADGSFWIGCYPGIGAAEREHVAACFGEFHSTRIRRAA
jgi:CDP-4-dehydro-6-deoxyglucose reductase, E1